MVITFSGVDGAGKTTHARYVVCFLEHNRWNVHYMHMIPWTLVNRLGRFVRSENNTGKRPQRDRPRGRIFVILWRLVALLDVLRFWILMIYVSMIKRQVIVCDRFFYDLGIQACYQGLMSTSFEEFYWRIIPSPTISILIDVSPEIARQREGEHSLAYYEIKRELYLACASYWKVNIVSGVNLNESQQEIRQLVEDHLE